jgi:hypothetical protein
VSVEELSSLELAVFDVLELFDVDVSLLLQPDGKRNEPFSHKQEQVRHNQTDEAECHHGRSSVVFELRFKDVVGVPNLVVGNHEDYEFVEHLEVVLPLLFEELGLQQVAVEEHTEDHVQHQLQSRVLGITQVVCAKAECCSSYDNHEEEVVPGLNVVTKLFVKEQELLVEVTSVLVVHHQLFVVLVHHPPNYRWEHEAQSKHDEANNDVELIVEVQVSIGSKV